MFNRSLSSKKPLDRIARTRIFRGEANRNSHPAIEGWKRPRDLDAFMK
jgi:hypothetical protein